MAPEIVKSDSSVFYLVFVVLISKRIKHSKVQNVSPAKVASSWNYHFSIWTTKEKSNCFASTQASFSNWKKSKLQNHFYRKGLKTMLYEEKIDLSCY